MLTVLLLAAGILTPTLVAGIAVRLRRRARRPARHRHGDWRPVHRAPRLGPAVGRVPVAAVHDLAVSRTAPLPTPTHPGGTR